ncbi:MAG: cytochrome c peroxidase [Pseudomonadota bacterium]
MKQLFPCALILVLAHPAVAERVVVDADAKVAYARYLEATPAAKRDEQGSAGGAQPQALTAADFRAHDPAVVELGRLLFFDKVLSGNGNIACASCHHPFGATGDGLSLPVGEGGRGFGVTRSLGAGGERVHERVPRHAPPLFNLGAVGLTSLFHDGRIERDTTHPAGFESPAGDALPRGLDSLAAAQALFPLTSATEMAGHPGENPQADAAGAGELIEVWELVTNRLRSIDAYVVRFAAAYDDVDEAADLTIVHVANAIGAFEETTWRSIDSRFDRYLRGDVIALSPRERHGMALFFGAAGCGDCHGGPLLTDQSFRAIGMPQIGPGKGDNLPGFQDGLDDFGRERVTGEVIDRFRFRVPPLRNVALTAPYGHAGAYASLEAVIRHHLDPIEALRIYDDRQLSLPPRRDLDARDRAFMSDGYSISALSAHVEIEPRDLADQEIGLLIDFLEALTDPTMLDRRVDVPIHVPSGLPVRD